MASFDYNPITGQLDLTGSGGSSYIDGVVADSSLLPTTLGTPALDAVYLAKAGSGVWLINRKPAGLYVRVANNGVAADWQFLGAFPEVNADGNWSLYNTSDPTRELKFDLSSLPTATVRTVGAPAGNGQMLVNTQPVQSNNGTLTASAPVLDLAQTWNDSGTAFTAVKLNITNTASASNTSGSKLVDISIDGSANILNIYRSSAAGSLQAPVFEFGNAGVVSRMRVRTGGGVGVNFDGAVCVGGSLQFLALSSTSTNAGDVTFFREAADTLGMFRSTNPQTVNIYNTYTNASNHERGFIRWSSNVLQIGTEAAGTGTNRNLEFHAGGTVRFTVNAAGGVTLAGGAAFAWGGGATRIIGATFPSGLLQFQTGSTDRLTIDANGIIGFGGTTSSFPALKRSSTTLQARLANDTDFTAIQGKLTTETAYTAGAPTATGYLVLYDSNGTAYKVPAEAL